MHPPDCPSWNYDNHANHHEILQETVADVLRRLATEDLDTKTVAVDTREVHGYVFRALTQHGFEYFAGHYRGEDYRCLRFYEVYVRGDPRVGAAAEDVPSLMSELSSEIASGLQTLDDSPEFTSGQRLRYAVALACHAFELFLRIHPYADGNGHAGRIIVWSMLGRYGYWPRSWPVEPRPQDPPYTRLLTEYRNGNKSPLETYILRSLVP